VHDKDKKREKNEASLNLFRLEYTLTKDLTNSLIPGIELGEQIKQKKKLKTNVYV
jgi:hypothetical protein